MSFISHIHGEEEIEGDKLQALREYFFLIETNDCSINRVECHDKIEELWKTGKDNKYLEYILHNLDIVIKYPINIELTYKQKERHEVKLKSILDKVEDWKKEELNIDMKKKRAKGNTGGNLN